MTEVLETIAPPYSQEFVSLFLPLVENEEITGTMDKVNHSTHENTQRYQTYSKLWPRTFFYQYYHHHYYLYTPNLKDKLLCSRLTWKVTQCPSSSFIARQLTDSTLLPETSNLLTAVARGDELNNQHGYSVLFHPIVHTISVRAVPEILPLFLAFFALRFCCETISISFPVMWPWNAKERTSCPVSCFATGLFF